MQSLKSCSFVAACILAGLCSHAGAVSLTLGQGQTGEGRNMDFSIRPEDMRDPWNSDPSLLRDEDAADCDGIACGTAIGDPDTGDPVSSLGRHSHLVASGYNPLASPQYIAVSK